MLAIRSVRKTPRLLGALLPNHQVPYTWQHRNPFQQLLVQVPPQLVSPFRHSTVEKLMLNARRSNPTVAKAEKEASKTVVKAEKEASKTVVKAEKEASKTVVKAEKEASKTVVKAEKEASKTVAKAEKEASKTVAKAEKEASKTVAKVGKEAKEAGIWPAKIRSPSHFSIQKERKTPK
jgi:vacuolar-type H+-ATPase subunit H